MRAETLFPIAGTELFAETEPSSTNRFRRQAARLIGSHSVDTACRVALFQACSWRGSPRSIPNVHRKRAEILVRFSFFALTTGVTACNGVGAFLNALPDLKVFATRTEF